MHWLCVHPQNDGRKGEQVWILKLNESKIWSHAALFNQIPTQCREVGGGWRLRWELTLSPALSVIKIKVITRTKCFKTYFFQRTVQSLSLNIDKIFNYLGFRPDGFPPPPPNSPFYAIPLCFPFKLPLCLSSTPASIIFLTFFQQISNFGRSGPQVVQAKNPVYQKQCWLSLFF